MSDDYDLKVLLELREREQEEAEEEYARQIQELERQKEYLAQRRADLEEAIERRKAVCAQHDERVEASGATLAQMNVFESYLSGLRQDEIQLRDSIDRAERAVSQQGEQVGEAKQDLIEATRELEAVEKHRENWQEERATEEQRRESAAMDEVAARRWMERNR